MYATVAGNIINAFKNHIAVIGSNYLVIMHYCPALLRRCVFGNYPAEGEGEPWFPRKHAHEAEAQVPVEDVLSDEGDE